MLLFFASDRKLSYIIRLDSILSCWSLSTMRINILLKYRENWWQMNLCCTGNFTNFRSYAGKSSSCMLLLVACKHMFLTPEKSLLPCDLNGPMRTIFQNWSSPICTWQFVTKACTELDMNDDIFWSIATQSHWDLFFIYFCIAAMIEVWMFRVVMPKLINRR